MVENRIIRVYGTPAPQGSKRHVGNGIMVESCKALKPWREAVKFACLEAYPKASDRMVSGAVGIRVDFIMPRPKSYPSGKLWADKKPDIDKLQRSTLDALKDAGIIEDDSRVVSIYASKTLAGCGNDDNPGAEIEIRSIA